MLFITQQFARISDYSEVDKLHIKCKKELGACKNLYGQASFVNKPDVDDWFKNQLPILFKEFKKNKFLVQI